MPSQRPTNKEMSDLEAFLDDTFKAFEGSDVWSDLNQIYIDLDDVFSDLKDKVDDLESENEKLKEQVEEYENA